MRGSAEHERFTKDDIVERLDQIAKLLALLVAEGNTQTDAILRLADVGFAPREIAHLLGTTSNTVRVTLSTKRTSRRRTVPGQGDKPS